MMSGAPALVFAPEGGLLLALMRGGAVAALMSLFGTLLLRGVLAPPVLRRMPAPQLARFEQGWRGLAHASWVAALLCLLAWLALQTAQFAEAASPLAIASVLPVVLRQTSFGHLVALRLVLLVVIALLPGRRLGWATLLAGVALLLQAGHSHAAAMEDGLTLLLAAETLHVLAAGAWLGALLPLFLLLRLAPPEAAALAARRFSPLGMACVAVLALTAFEQFRVLIGGLPGLVGTAHGLLALAKLVLFAALLALAAVNRFRLTPALATSDAAKRALLRSIALETALGLLVVLATATLSGLAPAMHTQPVWPFAERFSLDTINEDEGFRREVIEAVLALAGALALLPLAWLLRRWRWRLALLALAATIAGFAVPHFDLLLVDATPTSFYRSPTGFAAASITQGQAVFAKNCVECHGPDGRGDGPRAAALAVPPADLTAGHLWMHQDGELFWWLTHGIDEPNGDGTMAMPGFAATLSEDERWALIDYVRAHNAGVALREAGDYPAPLRAPDIECAAGGTLADLAGHFVLLAFGTAPPVPPEALACRAEPSAAYAILAGLAPDALPGTRFLVDDAGWLRDVEFADQHGWDNAAKLAADIARLRASPIAAAPGMDHMNMRM